MTSGRWTGSPPAFADVDNAHSGTGPMTPGAEEDASGFFIFKMQRRII